MSISPHFYWEDLSLTTPPPYFQSITAGTCIAIRKLQFLYIFSPTKKHMEFLFYSALTERPWFIGSPSPPGRGANVWRRRGEHGALWTPYFEYLRVIPTLTHYSDIVSDISFGHMTCIFWHSTCHEDNWHLLSSSVWIYLIFFLASILTFYLANGFALTPSQSCDGMPDILPSHGRVRSNKGNKVHTWLANWCLSFQTVSILSPCQQLSMRCDFSVRLEWPAGLHHGRFPSRCAHNLRDPQHFDRMLSDRPFPVSPFSLQPSVCVFSDSTKAQCHVAVPMSFGLVACVSVFFDGAKPTAVCPFSWPLASMMTPVLQAFALVFSECIILRTGHVAICREKRLWDK